MSARTSLGAPPLHPTVKAAGWVSFFTDVSSEMIYPLLPLFLTTELGAGARFVGLLEGLADTTSSLVKLWSGRLADRLDRRKGLMVAGYGLSSLSRPLVALATAAYQVLVLRFLDRVGKGIRSAPRDALVARVTAPSDLGRAFGFHRAMDHFGAVVGPLVAWALMRLGGLSMRQVFGLAAVPAAAAMAVAILRVSDPVTPTSSDGNATPIVVPSERIPASFWWLLAAVVVFSLGNSSDAFLPLRARELGVSEANLALIWSLLHIVKSVFASAGGALSDRVGRRRVIASGWALYALVYAGFAFCPRGPWIWGLFSVYGLVFALTEGPERALVAQAAPGGKAGSAFGLYHLAVGMAALPASLLAGFLWDAAGSRAALLTGAAFALAALAPLARSALDT